MNSSARPITEEDLHAYVDGFLDSERRIAVERYLAEHPEAAARLSAWQDVTRRLRDAVAWKANEPVPAALNVDRLVQAQLGRRWTSRRWGLWNMAASIVLALAIGAGGGWLAHGPRMPGGVAAVGIEAASAYRVFASDEIRAPELGPERRAELIDWASRQFGRKIVPPDLSRAGFTFEGGRRLATAYGPACMFFYRNAEGRRISVFVRPMIQRDMSAPMRPMQQSDAAGYVWARDGLGYGVVTGSPMKSLHNLSNTVRDAMPDGI